MKKVISAILVFALCLSLSSCDVLLDFIQKTPIGQNDRNDPSNLGDENKSEYTQHIVKPADDKITVEFNDHKQPDLKSFLDKLDLFAAKLTYELYSEAEGYENLAISPVSVYMALALAVECSNGETRDEILGAIGVSYDEVAMFTKYIYAYANLAYYSNDEDKQLSAFSRLANSIWADNDVSLKETGVDRLTADYNCDMFTVDYNSNEANEAINAYIEDMTHGLIDGDVDLSPETVITIINTFYLKEIWNAEGMDMSFTEDSYSFKNADGSITDTKLLKGYYNMGKVYDGEGYTSFYTTTEHGYEIKFILPDEGNTIADVFTAENIYASNNVDDYGHVDNENKILNYTRIFFPEFKASFNDDIASTLSSKFNINDMFNIETCDFSNIVNESVYCEGVIHKCSLEVNKTGIEGAAVTYIPVDGSAGPGEYREVYHNMVIDRAFGFVITDRYGVVLFCGVINAV